MLLPVFSGINYGYSYEAETGHYLLYDNEYKAHSYLRGNDAQIFREEIARIKAMPEPEHSPATLLETAISIYL